jgi:hypothetical protein
MSKFETIIIVDALWTAAEIVQDPQSISPEQLEAGFCVPLFRLKGVEASFI